MDEIRDSMGIAADPNNPFYQPPSTGELVTRALAGAIPAMIRPGQIPIGNRLLAGGAGAVGGMAGGISEALANKRLDPIARQLAINMAAGKAAQGITVPIPGTPEQTVPIVWPPDDHNPQSENAPSTLTIPGKPATSRAPENLSELLANASPRDRALLMTLPKPEMFIRQPHYAISDNRVIEINAPGGPRIISTLPDTPLQAAQLDETRAQAKEREARTTELTRKSAQQAAVADYLTEQLQTMVQTSEIRPEVAVAAIAEAREGRFTAATKLLSPSIPSSILATAMRGGEFSEQQLKAINKLDDADRNKVLDVWQTARRAAQRAGQDTELLGLRKQGIELENLLKQKRLETEELSALPKLGKAEDAKNVLDATIQNPAFEKLDNDKKREKLESIANQFGMTFTSDPLDAIANTWMGLGSPELDPAKAGLAPLQRQPKARMSVSDKLPQPPFAVNPSGAKPKSQSPVDRLREKYMTGR